MYVHIYSFFNKLPKTYLSTVSIWSCFIQSDAHSCEFHSRAVWRVHGQGNVTMRKWCLVPIVTPFSACVAGHRIRGERKPRYVFAPPAVDHVSALLADWTPLLPQPSGSSPTASWRLPESSPREFRATARTVTSAGSTSHSSASWTSAGVSSLAAETLSLDPFASDRPAAPMQLHLVNVLFTFLTLKDVPAFLKLLRRKYPTQIKNTLYCQSLGLSECCWPHFCFTASLSRAMKVPE